jgi:transposase
LASPRLSELFASVTEPEVEALFRARAARASGDWWFFDVTSISSYSELLARVKWGKSKEGTPLPQLNLAVVEDAASGLPVAYRDLPGNIGDVTLVRHLLASFEPLGVGGAKLCMDRGFYSKANIDHLMAAHAKFLIGAKTSLAWVKDAVAANAARLRSWDRWDEERGLYGLRLDHPWPFEEHHPRTGKTETQTVRSYLHLFFSPERAVQDERDLAKLLARIHAALRTGQVPEADQRQAERYFRKTRGGWTANDDAIDAKRAGFGYFALLSNDASLDCWAALGTYRAKDQIEKAFNDAKTPATS